MKIQKNAFLKYFILSIFAFTGIVNSLYAQVDQDELQNLPPVVFINYEGPHTIINTREEIRQIGVVLGREIAARERGIVPTLQAMSLEEKRQYSYMFQAGSTYRYFVIHSVSGPDGRKLDADIIGLGVDAGVDHIRNLRWIIQGYLQEAYDYSLNDAALLAEFITVYNAVYRGSWDYFTDRYKEPVLANLTSDKAGLSMRYDEWPGRTLIVIPLGHGILGPVDISSITDDRVINELRNEEDQSVSQRQDITELMEREAEASEQAATTIREEIRREEERITQEREQVTQQREQTTQEVQQVVNERQEIANERQHILNDLEAGRITEEEAKAMLEELDRREAELDRRERELEGILGELDDKDAELDDRESDIEQQALDADELDEQARRLEEEAQRIREGVADDQQNLINQENAGLVVEGGILGITIEQVNPSRGRLVRFNPATGYELRRSPLDSVHVRTVTFIDSKIIAVAGEAAGNRAVRLVEINPSTLEMVKQGNDDIMPGSLLWANGNDLYAIVTENESCYIGRFNTNLDLIVKSTVRVHPEAGISIQPNQLLTQRENGSVLILNPSDLRELF